MEAAVNMKMTPAEHRLIRKALETAAAISHSRAQDASNHPRLRRESREEEAQYTLLLQRL